MPPSAEYSGESPLRELLEIPSPGQCSEVRNVSESIQNSVHSTPVTLGVVGNAPNSLQQQAFEANPAPTALVQLNTLKIVQANEAFRALSSRAFSAEMSLASWLCDCQELLTTLRESSGEFPWALPIDLETPQGSEHFVCHCNLLNSIEPKTVVLALQNVSAQRRTNREAFRAANFDSLTNLPNRRLFDSELDRQIELAESEGTTLSLMFLDLDGFKEINDSLGHEAGDELLVQIAARLQKSLRKGDFIARLGGDEFAAINSSCSRFDAADTAERIISSIREPITVCGFPVKCSVSIGLASFPDEGKTGRELLHHADVAMYQAKRNKTGYSYFRAEDCERIQTRRNLRQELERLIAEDSEQIQLHFQPRINLRTGAISTVEALARWKHPERGYISPDLFISIAEETTLIHEFGKLILRRVCNQLLRWRSRDIDLRIALNLADKEFERSDIVEQFAETLENHQLPADAVEIEITENAAMRDIDRSVELLSHFKSLGAHIAIDDFGTGFTSLTSLKKLPADLIKIDHSFLRPVTDEESTESPDADIVRAIITLAESFHLQTVAEGVETEAQFRFLTKLGCDFAQGYFFNTPMPSADIERLILGY